MIIIRANVPEEITELHLLCDLCLGQNKNSTMIKFLMSLSVNRNTKINIYFAQRGQALLMIVSEMLRPLKA